MLICEKAVAISMIKILDFKLLIHNGCFTYT